uniref:Uncharacterized protein n=1 Tax=Timema poppense TaxID=170557 RepID=A0A7R9DK57_TIMPO|nr:unnamed protein product [Timema poppensis]
METAAKYRANSTLEKDLLKSAGLPFVLGKDPCLGLHRDLEWEYLFELGLVCRWCKLTTAIIKRTCALNCGGDRIGEEQLRWKGPHSVSSVGKTTWVGNAVVVWVKERPVHDTDEAGVLCGDDEPFENCFFIRLLLSDIFTTYNGRRLTSMNCSSQHECLFPEQLNEIRKSSISRLLCDNGDDIFSMQPKGFQKISHEIRWSGHAGLIGGYRTSFRVPTGQPNGKTCTQDDIRMDLKERERV